MPILYPELVALPLRIALGLYMLHAGWPKWKNFKGTVKMMKGMMPMPSLMAFLLVFAEVVGGLALIVGFATRIAAALIAISMTVALFMEAVKWKQPFSKWKLNILLIGTAIALILLGAGAYSFDAGIGWVYG